MTTSMFTHAVIQDAQQALNDVLQLLQNREYTKSYGPLTDVEQEVVNYAYFVANLFAEDVLQRFPHWSKQADRASRALKALEEAKKYMPRGEIRMLSKDEIQEDLLLPSTELTKEGVKVLMDAFIRAQLALDVVAKPFPFFRVLYRAQEWFGGGKTNG